MRMADRIDSYVSRGGVKLAAALDRFGVDVTGGCAVDFGCNVGGFTDCLIQRGAAQVFAVDTGYGVLAWTLRQDPRVVVLERTNVLDEDPASIAGFVGCDLVAIDVGWTRQCRAILAGLRWLKPDIASRIISLVKPHYEADPSMLKRGVLDDADAQVVFRRVLDQMPTFGVRVLDHMPSPLRGGAGKRKAGNVEYLVLLEAC